MLHLSIALTCVALVLSFKPRITRWIVSGQFLVISGMFGFLCWVFLANRFEFTYVLHHSSKTMPWFYKLSAVWAGDSGSLILWLFLLSVIVFYFSIKHPDNRSVIVSLLVFQLFILLSIFFSAPFSMTENLYRDGQGLNLLLRNFWMLSHPPVIFISYSILIVPFGYTIGFAINKDWSFSSWRDRTILWVLASWLLLGLGIALGAVWAYEVIGWGGYWGWDPVENATLIPWILLTATLHSLVASKASKTERRTSIGYMLSSFVAVMLAVFITRSGVMEKVSVHSFASQSMTIILGLLLLVSIAVSVYVFIGLRKRVRTDVEPPLLSKAFLVSATNVVLLLFSGAILLSTLWPVISSWFGKGQVLSTGFYSTIAVPVGIILIVGIAVSPVMKWSKTKLRPAVKKLILPIFLGLVSMWVLFELGVVNPVVTVLSFLGVVAISSAIRRLIEIPPRRWGGQIAHIGVVILIIGVAFSSNLVFSQQINLREGSDYEYVADNGLKLNEFSIDEQTGDYTATIALVNIHGDVQFKEIIGKWDSRIGVWVPTPNITRAFFLDIIVSPGKPELAVMLASSLGETGEGDGYGIKLESITVDKIELMMSYDDKNSAEMFFANEDGFFGPIEIEEGLSLSVDEVGKKYVKFEITDLRPGIGKTVMFPVKYCIKYLVSFVWIGMIISLLGIIWELMTRLSSSKAKKKLIQQTFNNEGENR